MNRVRDVCTSNSRAHLYCFVLVMKPNNRANHKGSHVKYSLLHNTLLMTI